MKLTIINSIRTNNFSDDQVMQKITAMWKTASNRIIKNERNTYGVYYNYESNYKGDYSLSVAIESNGEEPVLVIPDHEKYEIFKVDMDDEQGIFNTWCKIWEQEKSGTLKRAYSYDFEKYFSDGAIEIHIAVR